MDYGRVLNVMRSDDFKGAAALLEEMLQASSSDPEFWRLRGICAYRLGKHAEGEGYVRKALDLDASHIDSWIALGNIYQESRREQDALTAYLKGLEANPNSARLNMELAGHYFFQAAGIFVSKAGIPAGPLLPGSADDHLSKAKIHLLAADALNDQLSDRDKARLLGLLGAVYLELKSYSNARKCLKRGLAIDPTAPGIRSLESDLARAPKKWWPFW